MAALIRSVEEVRSKEDRLVEISSELRIGQRVKVAELSERFGVSEVTIRSDLDTLEARKVITRVRGGAIRVAGDGAALHHTYESDFRHDLQETPAAKRALATAAAALVSDGDSVYLDDSAAASFIAAELVRSRVRLLVATPSLPIAQSLSFKESFRVLLPGGTIQRSREALTGRFPDSMGGNLRFRIGFSAPAAFNVADGMLDLDAQLTESRGSALALCDRVVGLVEARALSNVGIYSYCSPAQVSTVLCDDDLDARQRRRIQQSIAELRVVET